LIILDWAIDSVHDFVHWRLSDPCGHFWRRTIAPFARANDVERILILSTINEGSDIGRSVGDTSMIYF